MPPSPPSRSPHPHARPLTARRRRRGALSAFLIQTGVAFAAAVAAPGPTLRAADEFPGIRTLMDEAQFTAAGLDKLSAEELERLDAWLLQYTAGEAPVLREQNAAVREAEKSFNLEARAEDFDGWNGDTLFRLDNGQLWRQRLDGRFAYGGGDNRVRIERNFLGYFRLVHIESGRAVGVTRLR
jgi:hypothetical protein